MFAVVVEIEVVADCMLPYLDSPDSVDDLLKYETSISQAIIKKGNDHRQD